MSERDSLRGIPFRLSKKFYPISRPQFRDIDIHIPLDALQEDYDFTLERQMIVKYDSYLEEKERLRIQVEEKLAQLRKKQEELAAAAAIEAAAEAERLAQLVISATKSESLSTLQEELPKLENGELQSLQRLENETENNKTASNQIVEPRSTHQAPLSFTIPKCEPAHNSGTKGISAQEKIGYAGRVSLSDFEADTANPFDSVELKSMNDKAELASIWGKVLQDEQERQQQHLSSNRSSTPSVMTYQMGQAPLTTHWAPTMQEFNPVVSTAYQYPMPVRLPCANPLPTSMANNSNARPINNSLISPPSTNESSSQSCQNIRNSSTSSNNILKEMNPATVPASSSDSFTKLHFPFLTSYTQTSTRDRGLERALERSYQQHYHQQFASQSSSVRPNVVPPGETIGFSPRVIPQQPILTSSSSASTLPSVQHNSNNYNSGSGSGINDRSPNLQNQTHNNFIVGHNYNWPLTTTQPPYEYPNLQHPTPK